MIAPICFSTFIRYDAEKRAIWTNPYSTCSVDEIAVYPQLYRKYKILVCKGIYNYIVNKEKFTVQIVFV